MRGKHAGFETLMQNLITHLLDIDEDVCHHAHNAAGKFCHALGGIIESLCNYMRKEIIAELFPKLSVLGFTCL